MTCHVKINLKRGFNMSEIADATAREREELHSKTREQLIAESQKRSKETMKYYASLPKNYDEFGRIIRDLEQPGVNLYNKGEKQEVFKSKEKSFDDLIDAYKKNASAGKYKDMYDSDRHTKSMRNFNKFSEKEPGLFGRWEMDESRDAKSQEIINGKKYVVSVENTQEGTLLKYKTGNEPQTEKIFKGLNTDEMISVIKDALEMPFFNKNKKVWQPEEVVTQPEIFYEMLERYTGIYLTDQKLYPISAINITHLHSPVEEKLKNAQRLDVAPLELKNGSELRRYSCEKPEGGTDYLLEVKKPFGGSFEYTVFTFKEKPNRPSCAVFVEQYDKKTEKALKEYTKKAEKAWGR